jgi:hypothetical protein
MALHFLTIAAPLAPCKREPIRQARFGARAVGREPFAALTAVVPVMLVVTRLILPVTSSRLLRSN